MFTYTIKILNFFGISAKYVYCGSNKPLWHCKHAFNKQVKCVYAICSSCKITLEVHLQTQSEENVTNQVVSASQKTVVTHILKIIKFGI